jgi:dihydrofolate reductase
MEIKSSLVVQKPEIRKRPFSIIVACQDYNDGKGLKLRIGTHGRIPWFIHEDMTFFKNTTMSKQKGIKNILIMGRKTFESFQGRLLPNRIHIVISSSPAVEAEEKLLTQKACESKMSAGKVETATAPAIVPDQRVYYTPNFESALERAWDLVARLPTINERDVTRIFVIGGARVYKEAILSIFCETIYFSLLNMLVDPFHAPSGALFVDQILSKNHGNFIEVDEREDVEVSLFLLLFTHTQMHVHIHTHKNVFLSEEWERLDYWNRMFAKVYSSSQVLPFIPIVG